MGVHSLPRTGLICLALVAYVVASAGSAFAAVPPFALVRQSIEEARKQQKSVSLDLRVTQTSGQLVEWDLVGTHAIGSLPKQLDRKDVAIQLLWIAVLSSDPVEQIQQRFGLINGSRATVGVQEEFVYVYGTVPGISVFRDLRRVAALSVSHEGTRWIVRLGWNDAGLSGVMVTRDGRTVLTARQRSTRPSRETK